MKKSMIISSVLLFGMSAFAQLGLQNILTTQGVQAMGNAVSEAAQNALASGAEPAAIQAQLIAILNEAAATGDELATRYAIVAVMMAGGERNMNFTTRTVQQSNAVAQYPEMVAKVIADMNAFAGGGDGDEYALGGGEKDNYTSGGNSPEIFLDVFLDGTVPDAGDVIQDIPVTRP